MNRPNKLFWIGLLIYFISFALRAEGGSNPNSGELRGIYCAWFAFALPLHDLYIWMFGNRDPVLSSLESLSLLLSGLINPLFVVALIFGLDRRYDHFAFRLRIAVVLMIPFCWAFFLLADQRPFAGHFLWIAGILLTMYSTQIAELWS